MRFSKNLQENLISKDPEGYVTIYCAQHHAAISITLESPEDLLNKSLDQKFPVVILKSNVLEQTDDSPANRLALITSGITILPNRRCFFKGSYG